MSYFYCLLPISQAGDGVRVGIYVNDLSSALVGSGVPLRSVGGLVQYIHVSKGCRRLTQRTDCEPAQSVEGSIRGESMGCEMKRASHRARPQGKR